MTTYYADYRFKQEDNGEIRGWIDRSTCPTAVPRIPHARGKTLGEVEAKLSRKANRAVGSANRVVLCEGTHFVGRK